MAITDWCPFRVPINPPYDQNGGLVSSGITLNASGDRIGFVIQCPKAGTLDKFEWKTGSVGNNPDNGMRMSFQGVDPTTGFPDGTPDQYRDITGTFSANTWQVPGLMTSDGTDGGSKRTVAAGEYLACVIDFVSFVASDSIVVAVSSSPISSNCNSQFVADASSGTYAKSTSQQPNLALKYDDGTYGVFTFPCWPLLDVEVTAFNTASTPDERALKIVGFPQNVRTIGAWAFGDFDGDLDIVLYDAASSVVDTASLDKDLRGVTTPGLSFVTWPNGPHTLTANSVYRVAVKPTSATTLYVNVQRLPSNAYLPYLPGGTNFLYSTRTDAGAWTDDDTRRPLIGLTLDGVEAAVATSTTHAVGFVG